MNGLCLLWKIDGPLEAEIKQALTRFGQRRELSGLTPAKIFFPSGQLPQGETISGLAIAKADNIQTNHFVISA